MTPRTIFKSLCLVLLLAPLTSAQDATPAEEPVAFTGRVVKVEGDKLTLRVREFTSEREVTVTTDANADVRISGRKAALSDLTPQMFAQVRTRPAQGDKPAYLSVQAGVMGYSGQVVKVDGKDLVLLARRDGRQQRQQVVVPTDENTKVRLANGPGNLADLEPGMRVYVKPETGTAAEVSVLQPPGPDALGQARGAGQVRLPGLRAMGTLVKVDGTSIVVRNPPNRAAGAQGDMTFATDENTRFLVDLDKGALADLKPEMRVTVTGRRAGEPLEAVVATSTGLFGTVVKADGPKLVVRVSARGGAREETAETDDKTRVVFFARLPGTPASPTVADVKPGMLVNVLPRTGKAEKIIVMERATEEPRKDESGAD